MFNTPLQHCAFPLGLLLVGSQVSSPSCSWLTEVGPSLPRETPSLSDVMYAMSAMTTLDEISPVIKKEEIKLNTVFY